MIVLKLISLGAVRVKKMLSVKKADFTFIIPRFNKRSDSASTYRVVGFEVKPHSVDRSSLKLDKMGAGSQCNVDLRSAERQRVDEKSREILFTYDVTWVVSSV